MIITGHCFNLVLDLCDLLSGKSLPTGDGLEDADENENEEEQPKKGKEKKPAKDKKRRKVKKSIIEIEDEPLEDSQFRILIVNS